MRRKRLVLLMCFAAAGFILLLSYSGTVFAVREETKQEAPEQKVPYDKPVEEIVKYLTPINEPTLFKTAEVSSCSECHDEEWEVDPERRELMEPHDEIPGEFVNHDSENRWCLDCHSANNRDKLRLINDKLVDFNEYYRLCEQCHRKIYREWKMGVHGKRTGYWNGIKEYWHCTQCHNPHNPLFKPIEPMPAPLKPSEIKARSAETKDSEAH